MLVSIEEAKRVKSFKSLSTADLTQWLDGASAIVETYCDRKFETDTFSERVNGNGTSRVIVSQRPITSITSVTVTDAVGVDYEMAASSFDTNSGAGVIAFEPENSEVMDVFPEGFQNVLVVYTAGYSSVPEDVKQATLAVAESLYSKASMSNPGVRQEKMGDWWLSYFEGAEGHALSPSAESLLSRYVNISL